MFHKVIAFANIETCVLFGGELLRGNAGAKAAGREAGRKIRSQVEFKNSSYEAEKRRSADSGRCYIIASGPRLKAAFKEYKKATTAS